MKPPKDDPKAGDLCVGCDHLPDPNFAHFYYVRGLFVERAGEQVEVSWIIRCQTCHEAKLPIPKGLSVFPVIRLRRDHSITRPT